MKSLRLLLSLSIVAVLFTQCMKDEMEEPDLKKGTLPDVVPSKMYTVTVENVSTAYKYFEAGAVAIPVITSYSIHYTKLYDGTPVDCGDVGMVLIHRKGFQVPGDLHAEFPGGT